MVDFILNVFTVSGALAWLIAFAYVASWVGLVLQNRFIESKEER